MTKNNNQIDMDLLDPMIENIYEEIPEECKDDVKEVDDGYLWVFEEYFYPKEVSKLHAIIYDYVCDGFGQNEAENPTWDIYSLAKHIHKTLGKPYKQKHRVGYRQDDCPFGREAERGAYDENE